MLNPKRPTPERRLHTLMVGRHVCFIDLGGDSAPAPAPDPAIGKAAEANAEVAREALAFNKLVYEEGKPRQERIDALADRLVNSQVQLAEKNAALADDYTNYMKGTFRPIEESLALDSQGYFDVSDEMAQKMGDDYLLRQKSGINRQYQNALAAIDQLERQGLAVTPETVTKVVTTTASGTGQGTTQDSAPMATSPFSRFFRHSQTSGGGGQDNGQTTTTEETTTSPGGYGADYYQAMRDRLKAGYDADIENAGAGLSSLQSTRASQQAQMDQAAGNAGAGVEAAYSQAERQAEAGLSSVGADPTSGKWQALKAKMAITKAADKAGSMNMARQTAKQLGWAKRMDAAGLGRNLPSNQATSTGLALNASNSALNSANAPGANARADAALMNQGFGAAVGANQSAGNLLLGQYNGQLSAWNSQNQAAAQESAGLGSLAGTAMMAFAI